MPIFNSFASNGECGLKLRAQARGRQAAQNSFASNGECGLKHCGHHGHGCNLVNSFASNGECGLKQRRGHQHHQHPENSFASNGECGLKRRALRIAFAASVQFIRQQWRMWIETASCPTTICPRFNSFASNGECGLKPIRTLDVMFDTF